MQNDEDHLQQEIPVSFFEVRGFHLNFLQAEIQEGLPTVEINDCAGYVHSSTYYFTVAKKIMPVHNE